MAKAKDSGTLKINTGGAAYRPGGAVPLVTVTYTTGDGREWTLKEGSDYKLSYSGTKIVSFKIKASNVDNAYSGAWNGSGFKKDIAQ